MGEHLSEEPVVIRATKMLIRAERESCAYRTLLSEVMNRSAIKDCQCEYCQAFKRRFAALEEWRKAGARISEALPEGRGI